MSTNTQQNEFIQSLEGDLTPEQAVQLLELGDMGDTGTQLPDDGGVPGASPGAGGADAGGDAGTTPNSGQQQAQADDADPANAVILAKDNKHTIPYERLVQAREGEKHWRAQAEAAQRQLAELQAQSQARADAGQAPTVTDNQVAAAQAAIDAGVDPGIFGDFSEEALAKGIATLVSSQVEAQVKARVNEALAPLQAKQASEANEQHYGAIYAAHPDADSIAESKELADWIATKSPYLQSAYQAIFAQGSTQDVIQLFDEFKQATGMTQQRAAAAPSADAVKAAAKAAIANAPAATPASLTDFPGGRPAALSKAEALAGMDGREMLDNMADMNPEQIENLLNRLG